jgi:hypothetical protein
MLEAVVGATLAKTGKKTDPTGVQEPATGASSPRKKFYSDTPVPPAQEAR